MTKIFESIFGKLSLSAASGTEELKRLNYRINEVKNAIATQANTVNVSGGGQTLYHETVTGDVDDFVVIANGLDTVRGTAIIERNGTYSNTEYGLFKGGPASSAGNGVELSLTAGGDFIATLTSAGTSVVTLSFISSPLLGGGLVGPVGAVGNDGATPYIQNGNWWIDGVDTGVAATGPAGADGNIVKTAWTNLTFAANWSDVGSSHFACQYRQFDDLTQIIGTATTSANWSSNTTIATLPNDGSRPSKRVPLATIANGGSVRLDILDDGRLLLVSHTGWADTGFVSLNLLFYSG